jgi:hypothetical protein
MGLLYGRAGRVTAENGGFRPGQGCGWGTAARLVVRDAAGRCLFDRHVTVSQGPADEQPFDVFDAPAGGR